MLVVFFVAVVLVFYVYIGYPVVLMVLAKLFARPIQKGAYQPTVSLIISAYNEEAIIEEKIKNTLALSCPKEKLEIIVCSDGSTDRTDDIVREYKDRIVLLRIEGRVGKPECQNRGVEMAKGEIVVFSDANSMYDPDALNHLMSNLHDESVGVVCGELRYVKNEKSTEGLYWKLERFLKQAESALDSCLGANGAIYAMRRSLYRPVPAEACSDFTEPFEAYRQGYRVVYEANAFCTEVPGDDVEEFRRKQRIVLNSFQSLYLIKDFLNPFRYGWYSIMLWSHKMLRWFAFIFLGVIFFSNLFLLHEPLFAGIFLLQLCFYLFAFLGMYSAQKPFSIPYYFTAVNMASLFAYIDFVAGRKITAWEKVR